jgi:hypothetical protein
MKYMLMQKITVTYLLHVSPNIQSVDKTTGNQMLSMRDDVGGVCQPTYL